MTTKIKTTNPYSGQSEMLTPEEHKLYVEVKQAEVNEDYTTNMIKYFITKQWPLLRIRNSEKVQASTGKKCATY